MAHTATLSDFSARNFRDWFSVFRDAGKAWYHDKALRLSAALAYYSIFSIAPLLIITLGIAGLVLDDKAATGQMYSELKVHVGPKAAEALQSMVESASKPKAGTMATIIGAATLLLGASGVLGQLKDALNTIWEVQPKPGIGFTFLIKEKFLNFGMVLVIGLLLLVSLVLSTFLSTLNQSFSQVLTLPAWVWSSVTMVTSFAVVTVLFALLFKILPDARIQWRDVWLGAVITATLFEIGKMGLSWYLGRESMADAYGPAGSVVLLILWVYYASCILLFGAEFTQAWAAASGRVIRPSRFAETVVEAEAAAPFRGTDAEKPVAVTSRVNPPGEKTSFEREFSRPPFTHRLLAPLLKYLEGRGMLLSIEAKEALGQAAVILVFAAVCCVTLFVAWTLLALALIGVLTLQLDWFWLTAVAVTGGVHLLAAGIVGLLAWRKITKGTWFSETLNELRKDRQWLRGTPSA